MAEQTIEHEENVQVVMAMIERVGTDGVIDAVADAIRAKATDGTGSDWLIDLASQIEELK